MALVFPQLFESVPDALVVVDETGRIALANQQAERLFGYPVGALSGLTIEHLIPEDARARHRSHRSRYMQSPRVRPMGGAGMALVGQRRDGAQFPVEIALSPLRLDEGTHYLASIRDISETQRARQALVRARYDALVARIGQEAIELTDQDALINRVPELLAITLGANAVVIAFLKEEPLMEIRASIGTPWSAGELFNTDHWQYVSSSHPLVLDDLEGSARPLPLLEGVAGSGAMVPLLDRGHVMGVVVARSSERSAFDHDAMHLLQSVANLVTAIIQRRRTEELLAHSQRLEAVGQLTGGIAHDFNNLLTVMSGSLQLLEERCLNDPESAELIASALRSASRGAELTRKLLAFARRQRLRPSAVSPARLLDDLEKMLRRTLGDTMQLVVECPADAPAVYADESQLDSALLNLILNARDAMPNGGEVRLSAETLVSQHGGASILFTVSDTGHGMSPETLALAVEPFFTTKQAGRGSGLGLSMVYGFVEQSGGHFHIDSRLGYGTRVQLSLPAAIASDTDATPTPAVSARAPGECVLVVEDEPAVRSIAIAFLRALGYHAHAVGSALEAIAHLAMHDEINILFSDVMLGSGMNGVDLALSARADHPRLAILLTSGYEDSPAFDGDQTRQFELLRKPYSREELATALRRSLQRR
ncbi:hypothetical protein AB839_03110 [Stenotrophomonas sp. DDT-1]|uniref:PAS domain S-box protein n=1 Tax=Stenotrophomonas sp. DDT-1 TaxID=1609637 RepID=UPI000776F6FA|nr:PAS domain S-box protein [Stenotrophomonas sp. DDT-1]KXU98390.1 hypothetical protein AB839_03110 [Stenotrophomonas sp. DDT-1]